MEFCTGLQESEEDLKKFFEENPDFPHDDPLDINFKPHEGER